MAYNPNIHHRRSIRLKGYDYGQAGAYFITLCTHDCTHLFGEIADGTMRLNEFGQIAYTEWLRTPELRPHVALDVFVIMPIHMHGIILINNTSKGESHSPNNTEPTQVPSAEMGECDSPQRSFLRSPSNNIGAIVRGYKSAVTKQINVLHSGTMVWQRNYYEYIIRHEQAYQNISEYITNNPLKWEADKFYS